MYITTENRRTDLFLWGFRRHPFSSQEFEMRFASELLDKDENYIHVGESRWDEYYIPRRDTTLPVYFRIKEKLHFDTEEEKQAFIRQHTEKKC